MPMSRQRLSIQQTREAPPEVPRVTVSEVHATQTRAERRVRISTGMNSSGRLALWPRPHPSPMDGIRTDSPVPIADNL